MDIQYEPEGFTGGQELAIYEITKSRGMFMHEFDELSLKQKARHLYGYQAQMKMTQYQTQEARKNSDKAGKKTPRRPTTGGIKQGRRK